MKGKYIQIRTEEKDTEGIFDYTLCEWDMLPLTLQLQDVVTFEEFLDVVINYLWQITEKNLSEIKRIIKEEIAQDYNNAFEELKMQYLKSVIRLSYVIYSKKIAEASTDMPNTLIRYAIGFSEHREQA